MADVPYGLALLLFVAVLVAWLLHLLFKWRNGWPQCEEAGARLPPGSRGLPLIGETLEFFARSPTLELPPFFKRRLEKYGPIFRTNVIGEDMIVSLDPEFNSLVMRQEEVFQIGYPNNFLRFFGDDNMNATGSLHRHVRGHVLRLFGPENLRLALLHDVQRAARAALPAWLDQPAIVVREAISRMIFSAIAKKLISHDDSASQLARLWESFREVVNGLIAFPLCIPGTTFYRCMQGRRNVMKTLEQQLQERKSAAKRESVDFLDLLIDELNKQEPILNEKIALNLLFGLMIASTETASMGLTTVLKFLTDNPKALHELTEEHQDIRKRKADPDSEITWEEYKSMKFTSHVIHESLRLANIAPLVFRKAKQDAHIKGYVIPEGSKIMICTSVPHLNPKVYEDPHVFYPWRWKDMREPVGGSKDFMAFGGGLRFCAGSDFAKLQMVVFLHYLVTKYRWRVVDGGTLAFSPLPFFPDGFRIQLLPEA